MSVSKDPKTRKWMAQCRIRDWQGKTIHRKKRGFLTKKEARDWERRLLSKEKTDIDMLFSDFIEIYFEDMKHRLRVSTLENKRWIVSRKIEPIFGKKTLNQITPNDIRKWQNTLTSYRDEKGKGYSQTYLKTVNNQLTALFNYAVKYYNLAENPCHKAGSMGKKEADKMLFWTWNEFNLFIPHLKYRPVAYAAFMTLYYTGMRIGELTALTFTDVDLEKKRIIINKSYQRLNGKEIITPPKTPKSNRVVIIPDILCECLKDYMSKNIEIKEGSRLFPLSKHFMKCEMDKACQKSGVKRIRIHDLRHSHASLLIDMGFTPLLIAERLGHEKTNTTLQIYSHLYPNKQNELAARLDELALNSFSSKNTANL